MSDWPSGPLLIKDPKNELQFQAMERALELAWAYLCDMRRYNRRLPTLEPSVLAAVENALPARLRGRM